MIAHLDPPGLTASPAFAQGMLAEGVSRLITVGGQNGLRPDGSLAGTDLGSQTVQALQNVLAVLSASGATQRDVIKLGIYVVQGQDVRAAFAAAQQAWGAHRTAITVLIVAGLAVPGALIEIDALAAL